MNKDETLRVRVDPEEKAAWQAQAEADGQRMLSRWIRQLAEDRIAGRGTVAPEDREAVKALTAEIRKVGVNLNRIAYAVAKHGAQALG